VSVCQNAGRVMLTIGPIREVVIRDARRLWDRDNDNEPPAHHKYPGIATLANETGIGERQLRRVLDESEHVTDAFADRYCVATGRHIFDLYPELDDRPSREIYQHTCKRCGWERMEIYGEGRYRIFLECPACQGRTSICAPNDPSLEYLRRKGGWNRRRDLEQRIDEIVAAYTRGATFRELSEEYGVAQSTIHLIFRRNGITARKAADIDRLREGWQRMLDEQHIHVRARRWRVARMSDSGMPTIEIAKQLNRSRSGVRLMRRDWALEPHEERQCSACERIYIAAPDEVVVVAPDLAGCPECGAAGAAAQSEEAAA
jgi:predicted  nucleic acid-binding Zn-ribbon protein